MATVEPYASYLHFAPENNHASTSSVRFLRSDSLPDTQPIASKHRRPVSKYIGKYITYIQIVSTISPDYESGASNSAYHLEQFKNDSKILAYV